MLCVIFGKYFYLLCLGVTRMTHNWFQAASSEQNKKLIAVYGRHVPVCWRNYDTTRPPYSCSCGAGCSRPLHTGNEVCCTFQQPQDTLPTVCRPLRTTTWLRSYFYTKRLLWRRDHRIQTHVIYSIGQVNDIMVLLSERIHELVEILNRRNGTTDHCLFFNLEKHRFKISGNLSTGIVPVFIIVREIWITIS